MTTRLNKTNIPVIEKFIIKSYNVKSQAREKYKNFLSIIDVWDVQNEIKEKFNISDKASIKATWGVYQKYSPVLNNGAKTKNWYD
tara:strand:+ start:667 stop:921 length:255 start_codon:yes stop_codon:yes gene_type:complete